MTEPPVVIEGEFEELPPETKALVVRSEEQPAGTLAVALLPKAEFDARLVALKGGVERVAQIQRALMKDGVDFDVIPGTKTPSLLKPGAEKLADFYNLRAEFQVTRTAGDGVTAPPIHYLVKCLLHLGALDGPVVADGQGSCSSWEKKYRYRGGGRECPNCGKATILRSKYPPKDDRNAAPGWWCNAKSGGCGTDFHFDDPRIAANAEQTENPDPYELDNTLLKMAEKRAFVDATLRATNASGLFTQDVGDNDTPSADSGAASPRGSAETQQPGSREPAEGGHGNPSSAGDTFEGPVNGVLESVKEREAEDWMPFPEGKRIAQGRLKFKVGNSNHTAMLYGDMAYAVHDAQIKEGERVRVRGEKHEVEWEQGKPKMKQLWHVQSVEVQRDGQWKLVEGNTLPFDPDPDVQEVMEKGAVIGAMVGVQPPPNIEDELPPFPDKAQHEEPISIAKLLALPWDDSPADDGLEIDAELIWLGAEWRKAGQADVAIVTLIGRNYQASGDFDIGKVRGVMDAEEALAQLCENLDQARWKFAFGEVVKVLGAWSHTAGGSKFIALTDLRASR